MGFPETNTVGKWLDTKTDAEWVKEASVKINSLKNPEIPVLKSYEGSAEDDFWEKFPKRELPERATTRVNVERFRSPVDDVKCKMSATEVRRANKVLEDLSEGGGVLTREESCRR